MQFSQSTIPSAGYITVTSESRFSVQQGMYAWRGGVAVPRPLGRAPARAIYVLYLTVLGERQLVHVGVLPSDLYGRSGPRSSQFERACRVARIVRRRLPGPNVKNERRQHHGEPHGGAGQDCGEAEPWRADAEIGGEFLTVWGVDGKPLGKQCAGERERQIESAQNRGNRYHARGNEGGKRRIAGEES